VAIELIFGGDEVLYRYFKSSPEISELKSILETLRHHIPLLKPIV